MTNCYLNKIATAVPAHDAHQKFVSFLPHLIRDERLLKVFGRLVAKSQIESRYSVLKPSSREDRLDDDGFFEPGAYASTGKRMDRYKKEALPLAIKAVAEVLDGVRREEVSHLIVTSCTGFYAPGLDLELQEAFSLRSDLERSIIGFMGCYAAFNALKAAAHIVRSQADAKVLIVNLELCSLHMQEHQEPEKVLGFLQFADGCAASLISAKPEGLRLERFRAEVVSDDRELIRWAIGDSGFDMILSPDVPQALGRSLASLLPKLMSAEERATMKLWAIHPGGRSILDTVQAKLELTDEEMRSSRDVLKNYGNMSSATIMFVLKRILEDAKAEGLGAAMAFGPGLTVESMIFAKRDWL